MVEIGSGIGRMTAGFTKRFRLVHAADVDAAFLERCRETVFHHGEPSALRTVHVADGRTLDLESSSVTLPSLTSRCSTAAPMMQSRWRTRPCA